MNHPYLDHQLSRLTDHQQRALSFILDELFAAEQKHPAWPGDIVHAAAIVGEEAGELLQAALNVHYQGSAVDPLVKESAQTGAVAVRFLADVLGQAIT